MRLAIGLGDQPVETGDTLKDRIGRSLVRTRLRTMSASRRVSGIRPPSKTSTQLSSMCEAPLPIVVVRSMLPLAHPRVVERLFWQMNPSPIRTSSVTR
jgi:hypothetical protein